MAYLDEELLVRRQ